MHKKGKRGIGKILLSMMMTLAIMVSVFTGVDAKEVKAAGYTLYLSDFTIAGTVGEEITPVEISATVEGTTWNSAYWDQEGSGELLRQWIINFPDGLKTQFVSLSDDQRTVTIRVSGTPAEQLVGVAELGSEFAANPNCTFNIRPDVSDAEKLAEVKQELENSLAEDSLLPEDWRELGISPQEFMLTNVQNYVHIRNADVNVSWDGEPVCQEPTRESEGYLRGTLTLTLGGERVAVQVNMTMSRLSMTDEEAVEDAVQFAEKAIEALIAEGKANNDLTEGAVLDQIANYLKNGVKVVPGNSQKVEATAESEGCLSGTVWLNRGDVSQLFSYNITLPKISEQVTYQVIKGDHTHWAYGSKDGVYFETNEGDGAKFEGLMLGTSGEMLDISCYTMLEGGRGFLLKPDFLETLTAEPYILKICYTDGIANAHFTVEGTKVNTGKDETNGNGNAGTDSTAPKPAETNTNKTVKAVKTGDTSNTVVYEALMVLAGVCVIAIVAIKKRKRMQ